MDEKAAKAKALLRGLIEKSSPDESMLDACEEELKILIDQKVAMEKILERLKQAGFSGGRGKLTEWLDRKGIRPIRRKKGE